MNDLIESEQTPSTAEKPPYQMLQLGRKVKYQKVTKSSTPTSSATHIK